MTATHLSRGAKAPLPATLPNGRKPQLNCGQLRVSRACGGGALVNADRSRQSPACDLPVLAGREQPVSAARDGAGDADPAKWRPLWVGRGNRHLERLADPHDRGQNTGYQVYLILLPGEGQGMVVMTNSDNGSILAEALIRRAAEA
jgi:hypothetical protein